MNSLTDQDCYRLADDAITYLKTLPAWNSMDIRAITVELFWSMDKWVSDPRLVLVSELRNVIGAVSIKTGRPYEYMALCIDAPVK